MGCHMRTKTVLFLSVLIWMLATGPASATTLHQHNFLFSFDGSGSTGTGGSAGPFQALDHLAVNQVDHTVYAIDGGYGGVVDKFDSNGTPQDFSGLGSGITSISIPGGFGGDGDIAIDNSGTSSQGQIYAFSEGQALHGFAPSGVEFGGPNFPIPPLGDMCGAAVDPQGNIWWSDYYSGLHGFSSGGASLNQTRVSVFGNCHLAIDPSQPPSPTSGYFYVAHWNGPVVAYDASGNQKYTLDSGANFGIAVDPSNGHIYLDHGGSIGEYAPSTTDTPGALLGTIGAPDPAHGFGGMCSGSRGVAVDDASGNVYVADCQTRIDVFGPGVDIVIPTVSIDSPDVSQTGATLRGHVDPDGGGDTTDCHFDWGTNANYLGGGSIPCVPAGPIHNADGNTAVSADISGLTEGTTYHYRLVVANANGSSVSPDQTFKAQGPPTISLESASEVNTDGARVSATVDPGGASTSYHFEFGETTSYGTSVPVPDSQIGSSIQPAPVTTFLSGLNPDTTYHYRVVATNDNGTTPGDDHTFTTYPSSTAPADSCPNAHVRQQTGAALLLDCRAYELVSATSTGGYDVESTLVPGQSPFDASPEAAGRILYSVHAGTIPGVGGHPTNFGNDPYLATRGSDGWATTYVGIGADDPSANGPFASTPSGSDAGLGIFAFGGADLCSPCFPDGSTGIPIRTPDGSLIQGMAGSLDPGPSATPAGSVAKHFSANGVHFVFGSTSQFEADGNSNGDVSIYDRDLSSGITHVVSKTPGGATMSGSGIAELDISENGSRILLGQKVSTDAAGNSHYHLYINLGDADHTIELAPSATSGVLYEGMSADGSKVFFTTPDQLTGADTDSSADLYEADVDGGGGVSLQLLSTGSGGTGNTDSCVPMANKDGAHWNVVGSAANCDVVGFAGGAGVASGNGTVYFLSPELLDGSANGAQDQPNLYVVRPGSPPHFVATLESDNPAVRHAVTNNEVHSYDDFQVTSNGAFSAFASSSPLTSFPNAGHSEVYRYDAGSGQLDCASCAPTNAAATGDASLSPSGLDLTDAGQVFFTTGDQLVLRDANNKKDAYEWEDGAVQLLSGGVRPVDSSFYSTSPDGTDAYFFTRDIFAPQDHNALLVKIYDARAGGGFAFNFPPQPCKASDECHGAGTTAAAPPDIGTFKGTGGNYTPPPKTRHHNHHRRRHHIRRHHHKTRHHRHG